MKPSDSLERNRAAIRAIVASHRACNPRIFGSVLHGVDTETSDLDILVDPTKETSLMDVAAIEVDLHHLLGIRVDVVTPKALPDSIRSRVLAEAVAI